MALDKNTIEKGDYIDDDGGMNLLGPSKGGEILANLRMKVIQNITSLQYVDPTLADFYNDKFNELKKEDERKAEYVRSVIFKSSSLFERIRGKRIMPPQRQLYNMELFDCDSFDKLSKLNNDIMSGTSYTSSRQRMVDHSNQNIETWLTR